MPTPWIDIAQAPRDVADAQPARGRSVVAQLLTLVADEARTPWAEESWKPWRVGEILAEN